MCKACKCCNRLGQRFNRVYIICIGGNIRGTALRWGLQTLQHVRAQSICNRLQATFYTSCVDSSVHDTSASLACQHRCCTAILLFAYLVGPVAVLFAPRPPHFSALVLLGSPGSAKNLNVVLIIVRVRYCQIIWPSQL